MCLRCNVSEFLRSQRSWLPDALERAGRAGGAAVLAALGLSGTGDLTDLAVLNEISKLPWQAALALGAATAAGSLALSLLARWRGDSSSASFRE